eukprot:9037906-Pyramimonas_sp.AAC.1
MASLLNIPLPRALMHVATTPSPTRPPSLSDVCSEITRAIGGLLAQRARCAVDWAQAWSVDVHQ